MVDGVCEAVRAFKTVRGGSAREWLHGEKKGRAEGGVGSAGGREEKGCDSTLPGGRVLLQSVPNANP